MIHSISSRCGTGSRTKRIMRKGGSGITSWRRALRIARHRDGQLHFAWASLSGILFQEAFGQRLLARAAATTVRLLLEHLLQPLSVALAVAAASRAYKSVNSII